MDEAKLKDTKFNHYKLFVKIIIALFILFENPVHLFGTQNYM